MKTLQEAIDSLPRSSWTAVRDFLIERHITGYPRTPCDCPISNYLNAETGIGLSVTGTIVGGGTYFVFRTCDISIHALAVLPSAVYDFICRFDGGDSSTAALRKQ